MARPAVKARIPLWPVCLYRGFCACSGPPGRHNACPHSEPPALLDLGTTFLASVARDPHALAVVDGPVRLTYAEWYRRISSLVSAFDALGLAPGDHLVTVLQNRWEAATVHWACQLAGIII